jgi:hypothetical protein
MSSLQEIAKMLVDRILLSPPVFIFFLYLRFITE